ncbi:putattive exported protein [Bordetella ansorpii]|uniref:Putattive exported protein n=1 Tax=Bordetella ansorpii TaxID=288768 RepID=A0A157Q3D5_9BORD|nr:tripartite tricarboxylate transporter substrate binding protein [Bordetella ansorpii]SAI40090.1 putattive exported protein [Bordetella ansorpii]
MSASRYTGAGRVPRRAFVCSLMALAIGAAFAPAVQAQDNYPDRPVRLIVPYPPGGATDVIGRVMAQELTGALGQSVVVENRAGAAGNIGADQVAKAAPDGYTLLLGALTSHSINAELYKGRVPYDIEKSFSPVSIVGTVPLVFVVNPTVKANTLQEFIALVKAKPGAMTMASSGNGSPQHLATEMFKRVAGVDVLHVPYKGSGPAMTDLMGGQVLGMIETVPAAQAHVKAGKLRALAVTAATRAEALPDVPTAAEAGLKGFEVSSMFGIVAPAGTPAPVIDKLNGTLKTILAKPSTREALLKQGAIATWTTPADAAKRIRAERKQWADVIREGNVVGE